MSRRILAIALAALLGSSCVTVRWQQTHGNDRILEARMARVEAGRSDLADSLDALGAPLRVWELQDGAFALAYGWTRDRDLGATITIPFSRLWSPSYSYDQLDGKLYGLVLVFDRDAELRVIREGYLRDIAPELRKTRPAYVEDADSDSTDGG